MTLVDVAWEAATGLRSKDQRLAVMPPTQPVVRIPPGTRVRRREARRTGSKVYVTLLLEQPDGRVRAASMVLTPGRCQVVDLL